MCPNSLKHLKWLHYLMGSASFCTERHGCLKANALPTHPGMVRPLIPLCFWAFGLDYKVQVKVKGERGTSILILFSQKNRWIKIQKKAKVFMSLSVFLGQNRDNSLCVDLRPQDVLFIGSVKDMSLKTKIVSCGEGQHLLVKILMPLFFIWPDHTDIALNSIIIYYSIFYVSIGLCLDSLCFWVNTIET